MINEQLLFERFREAFPIESPPGAPERLRARLVKTRMGPVRRPWFPIRIPQHRRFVAAVMVVVLVIAAAAAFVAINQYAHRVVNVKPHPGAGVRLCTTPGTVDMVDDRNGWNGTQRSTDGGITWHDASPPAPIGAVKGGGQSCALDANHAWVIQAVGTVAYQPTSFIVSATADGGQTWRNSVPILVSTSMTWRGNYDVVMTFLDDQHGWLIFDTGTASTPNYVRTVYASNDGGMTWTDIVTTASGGGKALSQLDLGCDESAITFTSLSRGWLSFSCSAGHIPAQPPATPPVGPPLLLTNDGGRTWSAAKVPSTASNCDAADAPVFSATDGMLKMRCGINAYFRTSDGGATWTPFSLPAPMPDAVQFVNGDTAFVFHVEQPPNAPSANDLYRSDDSGKTWKLVANALFAGQQVGEFQFVDTKTGYVNVPPGPWWTHDGGRNWTPPPGYRSVGTQVCSLPPAAPTGPITPTAMFSRMIGWASGAWRTTDGGAHWSNVAPASVRDREQGYGEFFLNADHAWIAETAGSAKSCVDHVVVLATTNGGTSWQQIAIINKQLPLLGPKTSGDWALSLSFVDVTHGWLFVQPSPQCGWACERFTPGTLFRTNDGGHHWVIASALVEDATDCVGIAPMSSGSSTTVWLRAQCNSDQVAFLNTHDGGESWSQSIFDPANCCVQSIPKMFDEVHGWFFDSNANKLFMTADGGASWKTAGLPKITYYTCYFGAKSADLGSHPMAPPPGPQQCPEESIVALTFRNPSEGWAVMVKPVSANRFVWYVERTTNGGGNWSVVSAAEPLDPSSQPGQYFVFVDPNDGFCWFGGTDLRVTHDGGRTWSRVTMQAG